MSKATVSGKQKELTRFSGNLPANPEELVDSLQKFNQTVKTGTGGLPFLKLLKTGIWAYGQDSTEVQEGSLWAMNLASLKHGWICWGEGDVLDETMVAFNAPMPSQDSLEDLGYAWDQQFSMQLQCMNGEDEGTVVHYKNTSLGMRNAVNQLIQEITQQLKSDPEHFIPVLDLKVESYKHKKYGEVFTPSLEVVEWVSYESGDAAELPPPAAEELEVGKEVTGAAPAVETPVRRRRKKASAKTEDVPPTASRRRCRPPAS